ncbi:MAG: hypothetical protein K6G49_02030 [Candidatus Saccharibacteria bacterium]|nr:hypothetical protein [Candidatus Saccharibacteria bacterium]
MANTNLNPFDAKGLDYRWWSGSDGNIWANVEGYGVMNLGKGTYATQNVASRQGLDANKQIADPNAPANNPTVTNEYNYTTGTGSGSTSAPDRNMINIYDRQISDIKDNLGTIDKQIDNALAGVKSEYDTYKNEQQSQYNANKNEYDNSTKQNQQQLQTNRNIITNRASSGLRGLLRILGAMGAGGGSVARYEAPGMVTKQANQEYNNAGQTYAQNQSNLDTDWGNYQNQFENDKKKLEDWYNGQVKSKKQEIYEKGQSLLTDLVTALGNRAQYGGDFGGDISDAYSRLADYRNKVNRLGEFSKPNYTGITAVYNSPDLASYDTGNTNLTTAVAESTAGTSPLLTALRGLNKKKTNSPYGNNMEA